MPQGRDPGGHQGRQTAQNGEFGQPHRHCGQAHQRRRSRRPGRRQTKRGQYPRQVRAHAGGDEPGAGEQDRELDHGAIPHHRLDGRRGLDGLRRATAMRRDHHRGQRQTDQEVHTRPGETGAPPAEMLFHPKGQRPAQAGAQAADQSNTGDRASGPVAIELNQDGERRAIEAQGHAGADHAQPHRQQRQARRETHQAKAEGKGQVAGDQHGLATMGVRPAPRRRPHQSRGQQGQGHQADHQAWPQGQVVGDGVAHHAQEVETGGEGQHLPGAERQHDRRGRESLGRHGQLLAALPNG